MEVKEGLIIKHASPPNGEVLPRFWRWLVLLGVVGGGAWVRFSGIPSTFASAGVPGPPIMFLWGARLYLLPWWNVSDWLRQNFFKSFIYTYHGLGDTVLPYLTVKVYGLLGVPLTEWNLLAAFALCSTATILLIYWLGTILVDSATGLVAAMLLAFSPTVLYIVQRGHSMNSVLFLQVASVIAYYKYVSKRGRWWAAPAALFMALQAGSENFYYTAIFFLLHLCVVWDRECPLRANLVALRKSFFSLPNLLVWTPAVLVWAIQVLVYVRLRESSLGVLGHLFEFRSHMPPFTYSWWFIGKMYNGVSYKYPLYAIALLIAFCWNAKHVRRPNLRGFIWMWSALIIFMILVGKPSSMTELSHLLVPSSLLVGMTLSDGLRLLARRIAPKHGVGPTVMVGAFLLALAVALFPTAYASRQWYRSTKSHNEYIYRGMKAAGAVVRTLGNPAMNVFILIQDQWWMDAMEYYTGLSLSNSDYERNQLFYHHPSYRTADGLLMPEDLFKPNHIPEFDFYVEFTREPPYPGKADLLSRLKSRGVRLVAAIYGSPEEVEPQANIYSPHPFPFRRYLMAEQERVFDERFANQQNLFYQVNVGTSYHFGPHWAIQR